MEKKSGLQPPPCNRKVRGKVNSYFRCPVKFRLLTKEGEGRRVPPRLKRNFGPSLRLRTSYSVESDESLSDETKLHILFTDSRKDRRSHFGPHTKQLSLSFVYVYDRNMFMSQSLGL